MDPQSDGQEEFTTGTKATPSPGPDTSGGPNDAGDSEPDRQKLEHLWNIFKDHFEKSLLGQAEDTTIRDAVWGAVLTAGGKLMQLQPEPYACTKSKHLSLKIDSIETRLDAAREGLGKDIDGLDNRLSSLHRKVMKDNREGRDKDLERGRQNHVLEGRITKLKKDTKSILKRGAAATANSEPAQRSLLTPQLATEARVNEADDITITQRLWKLEQIVNMVTDQNEKLEDQNEKLSKQVQELAKQVQELASRSK